MLWTFYSFSQLWLHDGTVVTYGWNSDRGAVIEAGVSDGGAQYGTETAGNLAKVRKFFAFLSCSGHFSSSTQLLDGEAVVTSDGTKAEEQSSNQETVRAPPMQGTQTEDLAWVCKFLLFCHALDISLHPRGARWSGGHLCMGIMLCSFQQNRGLRQKRIWPKACKWFGFLACSWHFSSLLQGPNNVKIQLCYWELSKGQHSQIVASILLKMETHYSELRL